MCLPWSPKECTVCSVGIKAFEPSHAFHSLLCSTDNDMAAHAFGPSSDLFHALRLLLCTDASRDITLLRKCHLVSTTIRAEAREEMEANDLLCSGFLPCGKFSSEAFMERAAMHEPTVLFEKMKRQRMDGRTALHHLVDAADGGELERMRALLRSSDRLVELFLMSSGTTDDTTPLTLTCKKGLDIEWLAFCALTKPNSQTLRANIIRMVTTPPDCYKCYPYPSAHRVRSFYEQGCGEDWNILRGFLTEGEDLAKFVGVFLLHAAFWDRYSGESFLRILRIQLYDFVQSVFTGGVAAFLRVHGDTVADTVLLGEHELPAAIYECLLLVWYAPSQHRLFVEQHITPYSLVEMVQALLDNVERIPLTTFECMEEEVGRMEIGEIMDGGEIEGVVEIMGTLKEAMAKHGKALMPGLGRKCVQAVLMGGRASQHAVPRAKALVKTMIEYEHGVVEDSVAGGREGNTL